MLAGNRIAHGWAEDESNCMLRTVWIPGQEVELRDFQMLSYQMRVGLEKCKVVQSSM